MTNSDRGQEERRLDDERCVDGLLAEVGLPDDTELRAVLLEMRNLRVTEVPEPSGKLAALMGQPDTADVISLKDWPRKNPRKKRIVFTTLAVAASLGVAGGAAAGNDTVRNQAEGTISSIVTSFFHPAPATPAPTSPVPTAPATAPKPAPQPARVPEPAPAVVLPSPASAPSAPVTVPVPRAEPPGGDLREDSQTLRRGRHVRDDVEPMRSTPVTPTGGKPAQPGASRGADMPRWAHERTAFERRVFERPALERPARGAERSDNRNANGNARHDGGTGHGGGHPRTAPGQGNRR